MGEEVEVQKICEGVTFRSIRDDRFKNMRLAVSFLTPMRKETAAANALLPPIMSRTSREYPDYTKMAEHLSELYGAGLSADVQKLGDMQVLSLRATGLADRYVLEGEAVSLEYSKLLCSVIFDPLRDGEGKFPEDSFLQEQRQAVEMLDSERNDKRTYARQRCEEILCEGEPYGVNRAGSREDVLRLSREELVPAWESLLRSAQIEILALGCCDPQPVARLFREAFEKIPREPAEPFPTVRREARAEPKRVEEKMDVAQSKLVLGFRTGDVPEEEESAFRLMSVVLGGTPHSKLFLNVREKLSLCYYCSARFQLQKGILLVESGVETKNAGRAEQEILRQLDEVRAGHVTEEELAAAKLSLCNSLRTVEDYLGGMESWYLSQVFRGRILTPEEAAAAVSAVTCEQVAQAARKMKLDTVYCLAGKGEEA